MAAIARFCCLICSIMPWFKKRPDGVLGIPPGWEKVGDGTLDCPLEWWLTSDWGTAVKDGLRSSAYLTSIAHFSAAAHDGQVGPGLLQAGGISLDDGQLGRNAGTCPPQTFSSRVRQNVAPQGTYIQTCLPVRLLCISEQDTLVQQKAAGPPPAGPASCSPMDRLQQHHSATITQQPSQLQSLAWSAGDSA